MEQVLTILQSIDLTTPALIAGPITLAAAALLIIFERPNMKAQKLRLQAGLETEED